MSQRESRSEPLAKFVRVRGRFHRSVHLPRDWSAPHDPGDYLTTPALLEIAGQILGELGQPGGERAWTVTGPYGSGKSAFAMFLTDLLAVRRPQHVQAARLRKRHLRGAEPLLPLLVQAERAPLMPALLGALLDTGAASRDLAVRARQWLEAPAGEGAVGVKILMEFVAACPGGLLLIVDELGKYLEYAAREPGEDIFLLQQIVEAAARSEPPVLFIGILHSGFGEYVTEGGEARRTEWQKVQGRFRDVAFSLPGEQSLDLVGSALETDFGNEVGRAYERRFEHIAGMEALRGLFARSDLKRRVFECLPLHPAAALILWPLFRSKVAQNERSLFAFLTGHEPHGFQEFVTRQAELETSAPLFGMPALYDYVSNALGMAVLTGRDSRQWSLIEHALERVPAAAPPLARALVKSIGLLALYGEAAGLRAGRDLLCAVFDDTAAGDVDEALSLLERESIVIFRRHSKAFGLWEGSDIDLDAAFETARRQRVEESLYRRLARPGRPRPLVARAHHVRTGTLRFFEPRLAAADTDSLEEALNEPVQADGLVLFVVDAALDEKTRAERARKLGRTLKIAKPVLMAISRSPAQLGEALDELECWEWIRENLPELEGDPVARQEVIARAADARLRFERTAGHTLGLLGHVIDPQASVWVFEGRECTPQPRRPRDLQGLISKICDEAYSKAPPLHNELLNRHDLSSAAAAARRNLLERMLTDGHRERLGISGFPPEYSMYESMLIEGGFHHRDGNRFRLRVPSSDLNHSSWKHVWEEVETFLKNSRRRQRPLTELFEALKAPPYGLREGPLPVLFTAALAIKGQELALYEDDIFVPDVGIEALERLVRRPHTFALRCYQLDARERQVIEVLSNEIGRPREDGDEPLGCEEQLIATVRQLVGLAQALPPYTQYTRSGLSAPVCAVRDLLRTARDPLALLWEDLPEALGVDVGGTDGPQAFAKALVGSLSELTSAFPKLLDTVEEEVRTAFGMNERGRDLQESLRLRALPLLKHAGDLRLRVFLREAAHEGTNNGHDWREALARTAAGGKPPNHWRDEDVDACATRLRALAAECAALSELVAAAGGDAAATVASIGLLEPGAGERRAVVACSGDEAKPVSDLTRKLRRTVRSSGLDSRSQLMALALAARELLPADAEAREATS